MFEYFTGINTLAQGANLQIKDNGDGTRNPIMFMDGNTNLGTIRYLASSNTIELRSYANNIYWTVAGPIPDGDSSSKIATTSWVNNATAGVNNVVHKTGSEQISGRKFFNTTVARQTTLDARVKPTEVQYVDYVDIYGIKLNQQNVEINDILSSIYTAWNPDGSVLLMASCANKDGKTYTQTVIATLRAAWSD